MTKNNTEVVVMNIEQTVSKIRIYDDKDAMAINKKTRKMLTSLSAYVTRSDISFMSNITFPFLSV